MTIDGEAITTTPEHPFFTADGEWTPAGALQIGDLVRNADGSYGRVEDWDIEYAPQIMYDLSVRAVHNFFVGSDAWLVHNVECNDPKYEGKEVAGMERGWRMDVVLKAPLPEGRPNAPLFLTIGEVDAAPHGRNLVAAHLLGDQLGGRTTKNQRLNGVALYRDVNQRGMQHQENKVLQAVNAGETVHYRVEAVFDEDNPVAVAVQLFAQGTLPDGSPGLRLAREIPNKFGFTDPGRDIPFPSDWE